MKERLEKRFMEPNELAGQGDNCYWVTSMGIRVSRMEDANLLTSRIEATIDTEEEKHFIIMDVDHEAELIPSSTPGHYHLYIYHEVTKEQLDKFVAVAREIGLIQQGIVRGYKERGVLCLRKPGVVKGDERPDVS
jgi:hypothetical protein